MIFNKFISLSLSVAIFASSAFAQGTAAPSVNLPTVDPSLTGDITIDNAYFNKRKPLFQVNPPLANPLPTIPGAVGIYQLPQTNFGNYVNFGVNGYKKEFSCPIWSLTCVDYTSPYLKQSSFQDTNQNLIRYFESKESCDIGMSTNLDELENVTDIASCYQDRQVSSEVTTRQNDYELFQADIKACGCLADKVTTFPSLAEILNIDRKDLKTKKSDTFSLERANDPYAVAEANVLAVREIMDRNSAGLAFQASIIGDGNTKFTVGFSVPPGELSYRAQSATDNLSLIRDAGKPSLIPPEGTLIGTNPLGKLSFASDTVLNLGRSAPDRRTFEEFNLTLTGSTNSPGPKASGSTSSIDVKRLNEITSKIGQQVTEPNPVLYQGEESLSKPQCIGAREYMAFKSIPDSPAVQAELRDPSKMTPANWNYKKLRADYDKLMAKDYNEKLENEAQIKLLKDKLMFLERNPMIKTFLGADDEDLSDYFTAKDITDSATQDDIRSFYKNDKNGNGLEKRKKDLIAMMGAVVPPVTCTDPGCLYKFMNNPETKNLAGKMKNFFSDPQNAQLTRTENDKTGVLLARNLVNNPDKLFSARPKSLRMKDLEESFAKTYGLGRPSQCNNPEESVDTCARIYSGWCQELREKKSVIEEQKYDNLALQDTIDDDVKDFFEPDLSKNKGLREFNDLVCNTKRRKDRFDQSGNPKTFWDYKNENCKSPADCDSREEIEALRVRYLSDYRASAKPGMEREDSIIAAFNGLIKRARIRDVSRNDTRDMMAGNRSYDFSIADWNDVNKEWGFDDNIIEGPSSVATTDRSSTDFSNVSGGSSTAKIDNKIDNSSPIMDTVPDMSQAYNYSSAANGGSTTVAAAETPKVENMSEGQRQELMDDWQKEYDAWKKNKNQNDGSSQASATESAMQARIQALEQLLAQQKKLTEDQYKLINEAIASKNQAANNPVVADQERPSSSSSNGRNRSASAISGSDEEEDVSRGPASVPNQPQISSGGGAGSAGVGSGGGSSSRRAAVGGSSDDVAREEAKLVNLRSTPDGSIVISATGTANPANAISVPVSDEQYRAIQSGTLNMSQLEQSIPKDQIAKLEKNGQITILLRNGANPPFEVKVQKVNNQLVVVKDQNGKDQKPVQRTYTRSALEGTLKAKK